MIHNRYVISFKDKNLLYQLLYQILISFVKFKTISKANLLLTLSFPGSHQGLEDT